MHKKETLYLNAVGKSRTLAELRDEYNEIVRLQGQQALAGINSPRTARLHDAARDALRRAEAAEQAA
jgi:hypothetical protein